MMGRPLCSNKIRGSLTLVSKTGIFPSNYANTVAADALVLCIAKAISIHGIAYVWLVDTCVLWRNISTTCAILSSRNDWKTHIYFIVSQNDYSHPSSSSSLVPNNKKILISSFSHWSKRTGLKFCITMYRTAIIDHFDQMKAFPEYFNRLMY